MKKVFDKIRFHLKLIWKHPQKVRIIKGYFLLFTGLNKFISIQKENYQIHFSRNVLALNSFIDPTSRNEEEWLLKILLNEKNTYVDIGANIGTLCLSASGSFNELDIYAFEANPKTFKALQNNIKLNQAKNIQAFQLALGEADKEINFSNSGTDDQNGVIKNNKYSYKQIKVQMKQLDKLFILPKIDVLKIDVEGYELFVLQGAKQNLDHCQFIYFEYSEQNASKYNYHAKELIAFLKSVGFLIYIPCKNGELLELKEFDPLSNIGEQNLLAFKDIALLRDKSIILK